MEGQIYTVSEVNGFIKNVIDGIPQLSGIYIRGELSNYKIYPSGHHYFTLKDGEGALRCVMFKGSAMKLRFRPENGMQVIAYGRISVFHGTEPISSTAPSCRQTAWGICMWPLNS